MSHSIAIPQIGYRTVFFWEYFGPLAVYPLFFLLPQLFYPGLTCALLDQHQPGSARRPALGGGRLLRCRRHSGHKPASTVWGVLLQCCRCAAGQAAPAAPPPFLCSPTSPRPLAQSLALAYWTLHYVKRIAETFLVHK